MVKNPPANAGDIRDAGSIPGSEDPLEETWLIHTSILAWKISMDRGAWRATGHGASKESETNEHTHRDRIKFILLLLIRLAYV